MRLRLFNRKTKSTNGKVCSLEFFDKIFITSVGGALGDMLMLWPLLRIIRKNAPKAEITWVTTSTPSVARHFSQILEQEPLFDKIIPLEKIQKDHISHCLIILCHTNAVKELIKKIKYYTVFDICNSHHAVMDASDFLAKTFGNGDSAENWIDGGFILPSEFVMKKARCIIPTPLCGNNVALCPGTYGMYKMWPINKFVELARKQKASGNNVFFILGPIETDMQEALESAVPGAFFPEQNSIWNGKFSFFQSIAIMMNMDAAVCVDSGTGHLLAAAHTPTIYLFSNTSPDMWMPVFSGPKKIIRTSSFGSKNMNSIPSGFINIVLLDLLKTTCKKNK